MTASGWIRIVGGDAPVTVVLSPEDRRAVRAANALHPTSRYDVAPPVSPGCHGDQWCRCDDCEDGRLSARGAW